MAFQAGDRSGAFRKRPSGTNVSRVLIASQDRRFIEQAALKLRGTPIHVSVVMDAERVLREIQRARPHVLVISSSLTGVDSMLASILPRRYPNLPVLVVSSEGRVNRSRDWQIVSWGGVGVVSKEELLRGHVLSQIIIELARANSDGGATNL